MRREIWSCRPKNYAPPDSPCSWQLISGYNQSQVSPIGPIYFYLSCILSLLTFSGCNEDLLEINWTFQSKGIYSIEY